MELKEIASLAGKSGLFRVMKPARNGVVLEALGGPKTPVLAGATARVSILQEISIYTTTSEGTIPLAEVLYRINEKYSHQLPKVSTNDELREVLGSVLPEFDRERVYVSDIKKLFSWYMILVQYAPEVLVRKAEAPAETEQA